VADKDKAILQERLLPQIAALLPEYGRLRVRIVFDQAGHWRSGEVFNTTKGCFITIPPEIVQPLKIKELKGLTCEAIFTPAEVAAARAKAKPAPTPLKMATAEQRLRTELGPIFAHYLLADLRTPAEADVEIEVSANGRIASVKASAILPDPKAPTESNVKRDLINPKTMQMAMRYMRITDPTLLGKTWTIHYSSEELRKASADVHAKYKLMLIETEPYTTEEAPEPPRGPPGTSIWDIPRRKF
jgi:hypothetical protein